MTTNRVCKFRLFCETENDYFYTWNTEIPLYCPNNNTHTITSSTISVVDTVDTSTMSVTQEPIKTGGNYRTEVFAIDTSAGNITTHSWSYNTTILNYSFITFDNNIGDSIDITFGEDTPIGYNTTEVSNSSLVPVSQTVVANAYAGYFISTGTLGSTEIISVDKQGLTITLENNVDIPIYTTLLLTVKPVKNFTLANNTFYDLAKKSLSGSGVPAGVAFKLVYNNSTPATQKKMHVVLEYLY